MRLYEIRDAEGRVFAFELDNSSVGRSRVLETIATVPGARIKRKPKLFSWLREEVFCEFEVDGIDFVAWEPFGDNSRYWIGPEPARWTPQIEPVREAFVRA